MYDVEQEIEVLESVLSSLESMVGEFHDSPYFSYLKGSYEDDIYDIQQRLEELYEIQNDYWAREMREQNRQFEGSRL